MSIHNRTIAEEIRWRYNNGGMVTRLIMINIGVFLLVNFVRLGFVLMSNGENFEARIDQFDHLLHYISLPAAPKVLIKQLWSLVTYMFVHEGPIHILFNMLWLYWFGSLFKQFIGESRLYPVYMMGGLFGGLLYMAAYNVFPMFEGVPGSLIGASAAVMAIVFATATMVPNYTIHLMFLGSVQLKWLALVVAVMDLISIQNGNAGGHISHLGGALFGFLYAVQYRNSNDLARPFYAVNDFFKKLFDFSSKPKKQKPKMRTVFKNKEKVKQHQDKKTTTAAKKTYTPKDKQARIDEILDKIGQSGYPSLTEEEKAFLFQYSKE